MESVVSGCSNFAKVSLFNSYLHKNPLELLFIFLLHIEHQLYSTTALRINCYCRCTLGRYTITTLCLKMPMARIISTRLHYFQVLPNHLWKIHTHIKIIFYYVWRKGLKVQTKILLAHTNSNTLKEQKKLENVLTLYLAYLSYYRKGYCLTWFFTYRCKPYSSV